MRRHFCISRPHPSIYSLDALHPSCNKLFLMHHPCRGRYAMTCGGARSSSAIISHDSLNWSSRIQLHSKLPLNVQMIPALKLRALFRVMFLIICRRLRTFMQRKKTRAREFISARSRSVQIPRDTENNTRQIIRSLF